MRRDLLRVHIYGMVAAMNIWICDHGRVSVKTLLNSQGFIPARERGELREWTDSMRPGKFIPASDRA